MAWRRDQHVRGHRAVEPDALSHTVVRTSVRATCRRFNERYAVTILGTAANKLFL